MYYKKPQSTLVQGGAGIYPLTTADQVILADGSRLEKNGKISADSASDSSKLGRKAPEYYIQPRNLLDNSDFRNPVNQRGKTSVSNNGYFIDRWSIYSPNEANKVTSIDSNGLTTAGGGAVRQIVSKEVTPKDTSEYTFAACKSDGSIHIYNLYRNSSGDMVCAIQSEGTLIWAALYEGNYTADTLPPYVPKGYAAELAECQRYFYSMTSHWKYISAGICTSTTKCKIPIQIPQAMRIKPTVTIVDKSLVKIKAGSVDIQVPSEVSWTNATRIYDILYMECTITGATNGDIAMLYFDDGGRIDFSADL